MNDFTALHCLMDFFKYLTWSFWEEVNLEI